MHHCPKFYQNRSILYRDIVIFLFFKDGGRLPPTGICLGLIWTNNEEYLVVFIAEKNLVAINAVYSFHNIKV